MSKQEYKSAIRSKAYIKHALIKLLSKKDLDRITVTEVIETSGISRGTFYSHYKSLDDVINQIIDDEYTKIVGLIGENCEIYFNPDNVLMIVSTIFDYISDDKDYYTGIIGYKPIYDSVMAKISEKYRAQAFKAIKENCTIQSDDEANYVLVYTVGGIIYEILKWAKDDTDLNAEMVVNIMRSMFRNYIK